MDPEWFREHGKEMVDYVIEYMATIDQRKVSPNVEPGYLRKLLPGEAPMQPEPWDDVMKDVESKIMPGVLHWNHPKFHAYFPAANSFPGLLGDILGGAIGCLGFTWISSPACTELEIVMMDWMAKAIGLPKFFLADDDESGGGGVIQGSASDAIFVVMMAARANAVRRLKKIYCHEDDGVLLSKLIAYASEEAHSSVEKAAMMSFVKLRILAADEHGRLPPESLRKAMEEDCKNGRVPFFVSTTLGTTARAAFDKISEIGPIAKSCPAVWFHVDGAYGGNALLCPEMRYAGAGMEYADSFNFNPNKWMLTNFDCSLLWVRNRCLLTAAMVVNPKYLEYDKKAIDYRHWGTPLSRRFRSLKLWFVLRSYGISALQSYIRNHIKLAKYFEALVRTDSRFIVCNDVLLGLVCFRLVSDTEDEDELNKRFVTALNASRRIHLTPAIVKKRLAIRLCLTYQHSKKHHIDESWDIITEIANEVLQESGKDRDLGELEATRRATQANKKSYFVRMVSDPNNSNSRIVRPTQAGALTPREYSRSMDSSGSPTSNSWISWPLGMFFESKDHDPNSDLLVRYVNIQVTT